MEVKEIFRVFDEEIKGKDDCIELYTKVKSECVIDGVAEIRTYDKCVGRITGHDALQEWGGDKLVIIKDADVFDYNFRDFNVPQYMVDLGTVEYYKVR
jgi:hypothetical protein